MPITPLYNPKTTTVAAYQLRYAWTGWPSSLRFELQPSRLVQETIPLWEQDGLRVLEHRWTDEFVQILFSATPNTSPTFIAARAKGRLDHALREAGLPIPFSRKVALRSVGDATCRDIEAYIERQVPKEQFADPQFASAIAELTVTDPAADLSLPTESARGRYWYNLHMVLVVEGRVRLHDTNLLRQIRDCCLKIAAKKGHAVSRLSVMPDHLHVALRGQIEESPVDIVFVYQNNLAHMLSRGRLWSDGYYVGTFGEYTTQAIHQCDGAKF